MPHVPSMDEISDKWSRRASQAGQDYEQGVSRTSSEDQQRATAQAAGRWEEGVQRAAADDAFRRGVQDPNKDWQTASLELGSSRFTQGVQANQDAYSQGFAPFRDVIEQTQLPERGPRGDVEQNIQRVRAIANALNEAKRGR